jgi:hypothetical protein
VSLSLAKDQHLSLNPAQISGGCGRLLCCLRYEHEFYVAARKRFPKEGKTLKTARGPEKVVAVDIFRERVFLRNDEQGPRTIMLTELKQEMESLGEVLPLPAERPPRPAVPRPQRPEPPEAQAPAGEQDPTRRKRRRRRSRRGRRPDGGPPPPAAES